MVASRVAPEYVNNDASVSYPDGLQPSQRREDQQRQTNLSVLWDAQAMLAVAAVIVSLVLFSSVVVAAASQPSQRRRESRIIPYAAVHQYVRYPVDSHTTLSYQQVYKAVEGIPKRLVAVGRHTEDCMSKQKTERTGLHQPAKSHSLEDFSGQVQTHGTIQPVSGSTEEQAHQVASQSSMHTHVCADCGNHLGPCLGPFLLSPDALQSIALEPGVVGSNVQSIYQADDAVGAGDNLIDEILHAEDFFLQLFSSISEDTDSNGGLGTSVQRGRRQDALSETLCMICLVSWTAGDVVACLPCQHQLHAACLQKWAASHSAGSHRCPMCKTPIV